MQCGDPAWTQALRDTFETTLVAAGADATDVHFSISEQYDAPPEDLAPDSGPLGWTCRIVGGSIIEFSRQPQPDVDLRVRLDYAVFDELARIVVDGDSATQVRMDERAGQAIQQGRMSVDGSAAGAPPWLMAAVHDTMARTILAATQEDSR
ncbi:MAG: hypothetical protein ABIQ39_02260 [Ilumatobacteraceae bacterium]